VIKNVVMSEYKMIERGDRKMGYKEEFREIIRNGNKIPKRIISALEKINNKDETLSENGLDIVCIDKSVYENEENSISFKVTLEGESYFVKVEKISVDKNGGFVEFNSTVCANSYISNIRLDGFRVVEPLLGYQDEKNGKSYYV
jgi:hypothetical protein